MTLFYFIAAAMIVLGLAFVLPPLLRQPRLNAPQRDELNIAIYRQRQQELETDLAIGTISQEQFDTAQQELQRGLGEDLGAEEQVQTLQGGTRRLTAVVVGIIMAVAAVIVYYQLKPAQLVDLVEGNIKAPTRSAAGAHGQAGQLGGIDEMVVSLEKKLEANPDNGEGWLMLGRSYMVLKRYQDAVQAFGTAYDQLGESPELLSNYADAVAMNQGGSLEGPPRRLLERALELDPNHAKSLWMAGYAAFRAEQFDVAVKHWERLSTLHPDDNSEGAQTLHRALAEAKARLAESGGQVAPATPVASAESPRTAGATAADSQQASLSVTVELDTKLSAKAAPEDTVFIFARAVQGPPMPLAIVRKQAKELPVTVELTDAMAMMPEMKLSNFEQVFVGARISKSGAATAQSGDLQGRSGAIDVGAGAPVVVHIDQEVL